MKDFSNDDKSFNGQTFKDLKFSEQTVFYKEFYNCSFKSCDFNQAIFDNCEFNNCKFNECNLNNLAVDNSKFADVEFNDCKIIGVNWTQAYWRGLVLSAPLSFKDCMINSSSLYGLNLQKIVIKQCRAHDVDFRETNLSGVNFCHTDLMNSLFNNTNLTDANFSEAENYDINIRNNIINKATFSRHEAVRLLNSLDINLID